MKRKLLVFILTLFCGFCFSQNTFVPDDAFEQALIDLGLDSGTLDDLVPTANIESISVLDIAAKGIADFTGIEDFASLVELRCNNNRLASSLDVSQNTKLVKLFCNNNEIDFLDLTNSPDLEELYCFNNPFLETLNVSQNVNLRILEFSNTIVLDAVDVSNCPLLERLLAENSNLSSIDLSNNSLLNNLTLSFNNLGSLDVTNNTALQFLRCRENNLTELDVSMNPALVLIDCEVNNISSLNVDQNPELVFLACDDNQISALDLSKNAKMKWLLCEDNQLESLNVKNGNNEIFIEIGARNNPNLFCMQVDNVSTIENIMSLLIDNQVVLSQNCSTLSSPEERLASLELYPNPSSNELILTEINTMTNFIVYSAQGSVVKEGILIPGKNTINLSTINGGAYVLKLVSPIGSISKKFLKL